MAEDILSRSKAWRVAIVGTGYVGLVTGACLAELGNTVVCLDNDEDKIAALRAGNELFFEPGLREIAQRNYDAGRLIFSDDLVRGIQDASIVFVAVGTPMCSDGKADLSHVIEVAKTIGRVLNSPKLVVLKSSVPIRTCELVAAIIAENAVGPHDVEVISNPEFLREGTAVADFMRPERIVIGTASEQAETVMRELYAPLAAPFVVTDVCTSEMIKYTANAFLATKISFMNEIANICELVGVDVKAVGEGIALDERIGSRFMNPGIGYGGSCLPKDVLALERVAHAQSYDATLLRSIDGINRAQVHRSFAKVERALGGSVHGKAVCVLGLAFKPNTSDVREAPALHLIDMLVRSGASVTAHDPVSVECARAKLDANVKYSPDIYKAMQGCDILILATEWDEYKGINFKKARRLMRGNVVFDGRNIFDADSVVAAGLRYIGVGRAKARTSSSGVINKGSRRMVRA